MKNHHFKSNHELQVPYWFQQYSLIAKIILGYSPSIEIGQSISMTASGKKIVLLFFLPV
ncbi:MULTISPECIES: hypothetical protein [Sediminibacillus]|uniref:hypothetical protein n=1 Tax=Sediminibacillus TaxID=482460 RepID=UPI00040A9936|nr:hypothetical protein [Sediminibacillus terrae]